MATWCEQALERLSESGYRRGGARQAVIELLDSENVELKGAEAVVIGRSQLVGRPLASLLLQRDAPAIVAAALTVLDR